MKDGVVVLHAVLIVVDAVVTRTAEVVLGLLWRHVDQVGCGGALLGNRGGRQQGSQSQTDLDTVVADGASDVIHVEVQISRDGKLQLTTGWLVTRR